MTIEERIEREQEKNKRLRIEIEDLKTERHRLWPTPRRGGSALRALALGGPLTERQHQLNESDVRLAALKLDKEEGAQSAPASDFQHTEDYRWVSINGQEFRLTSMQAEIVELLHKGHLDGKPEVGVNSILTRIGSSSSRLRDIFRSRPGYMEALIKTTTRGIVRLNL